MITDKVLIFATDEAVPDAGAGGMGGNTISGVAGTPHYVDLGADDNPLGVGISQIGFAKLEMKVAVTTDFTTGPNVLTEFQLISVPILPTLFAAGTTSGRRMNVSATGDVTDNDFDLAAHGFPMGTPVYISSLGTVTGPSTNTIYYISPKSSGAFAISTTYANAIAGTHVSLGGSDSAVVFEVFPYVHATTGPVWAEFINGPTVLTGRSVPGINAPVGKLVAPYSGATRLPAGASAPPSTSQGGGGEVPYLPNPGRYLAMRVYASGAGLDTTGRYSVAVGLEAGEANRYFQPGLEVL